MLPRKCNSVRISHSCFWTSATHFTTRNVDKVHKAITTKFGKMSTEEPAEAIAGIDQLNAEIQELHMQLAAKKHQLRELQQTAQEEPPSTATGAAAAATPTPRVNELSNDEIERYSRQLILPGFGVAAQLQLKHSAFLIVGMGGLGCPAAQYLLAAGCGHLGLVDYDDVERSNFHRQTLHTESYIGMPKVQSAQWALIRINPNCQIDMHRLVLNSDNAMDIIAQYDVVLDCTDNVATRYLLNDACVMLHKPLVSGSALQLDGQLTVYHYGATGPCYRCLFPVPPPPETVTNCGDGGVLGAVTGTIGALQALEAIKVVTSLGDVLAGHLLIFDGARCTFRKVRLRGRRSDCDVCSEKPMITRLINYELFCSMHATDSAHPLQLLSEDERISVQQYRELQAQPHLLIDVRQPAEFEICRLPGAVNVPLKCVLDDSYVERYGAQLSCEEFPTVVLCRRGNDSQIAVQHMRNKFPHSSIRDIVGGLHAWHYKVDKEFPIY